MAKRLSRSKRAGRSGGGNIAPNASRPAMASAAPQDLTAEYSYVLRDLARIGIIAAILIGGLVALSFVLR